MIKCVKCGCDVNVDDTFCTGCGARRWYWLELLRNGLWHQVRTRETILTCDQNRYLSGAAVVGVAAAWLALFLGLRRRVQQ